MFRATDCGCEGMLRLGRDACGRCHGAAANVPGDESEISHLSVFDTPSALFSPIDFISECYFWLK